MSCIYIEQLEDVPQQQQVSMERALRPQRTSRLHRGAWLTTFNRKPHVILTVLRGDVYIYIYIQTSLIKRQMRGIRS